MAADTIRLKTEGLSRQLPEIQARRCGKIRINGRWLLNLASNDYLGLAQHPELVRAMCDEAHRTGIGASGSRLMCGTLPPHSKLERELAHFKRCEAALTFPSGYQANLAAITSLADRRTVIYSDAFNHASIVDACRLSGSTRRIYPHADARILAEIMERDRNLFNRRLVVSDSVFSADGTLAPVEDLNRLCVRFNALFIVDEAHATGVLGPTGKGLLAQRNLTADFQVATMSKAFGCSGGFVASSRPFHDHLLNHGRSFIYTTAPPPPLAAACRTALRLITGPIGDQLRARLMHNVALLSNSLKQAGWPIRSDSHILAIPFGDPFRAIDAARWLQTRGVFVMPFRPPTVPKDRSVIRLTPTAAHSEAHMRRAAEILNDLLEHSKHTGAPT